MPRESYVFRNGELVPKHLAGPHPSQRTEARADFPVPFVMRDLPAYRSTSGQMIDGRVEHREYLKRNGLIEVGNDYVAPPSRAERIEKIRKDMGDVKADIAESIQALEHGMPFQPEEIVKADDFGLGHAPENGTVLKTEVDSTLV